MIRIKLDFADYRAPDPHGVMIVAYSTECATHSTAIKKPKHVTHVALWCHLPSMHARYRIAPHVMYDPLPSPIAAAWTNMIVTHKDMLTTPATEGSLQRTQRPCSVVVSIYQNVEWTFAGDRRIEQWKKNHAQKQQQQQLPLALLSQLHIDNILIGPERLYEAHAKGTCTWRATIVDVRRMTQDTEASESSCIYGSVQVTLEHVTDQGVPAIALPAPPSRPRMNVSDAIKAKLDYTEEYIKTFPRPFSKFKKVGAHLKSVFDYDSASGMHGVWYPRADHSVNIHMPIMDVYAHSARQALAVPVFYYYAHRQDPPWLVHERFLESVLRAAAASHGYNIEQERGRAGLMRLFQRALSESDDPYACATAMEIIVHMLTAYATHGKYRSDYRMRPDGERVELESIDMDVSLTDSDDCEGKSNTTHQVIFLIMYGRPDVPVTQAPCIMSDRLWTEVLLARSVGQFGYNATSFRRSTHGTWESPLLQQVQCILGHYMPCSVLGSVLAAFLDADHASIPRVDADALETDPAIGAAFRIGAGPDVTCQSGGHQWDLLLPMGDFMRRLKRSLTTEMGRTSTRFTLDQVEVNAALLVCDEVAAVPELPLEMLGGLVVESTGRATPWLQSRRAELDEGTRAARRVAQQVRQCKALRGGVLVAKNHHVMRRASTDGAWRRASSFYRDVMHMVCVRLYDLCGARDLCSLSPVDGHRWGVPLEDVIGRDGSWRALPVLHRMDRSVRDRLHSVMQPYYAIFPPISIGSWLSQEQSSQTLTRAITTMAERLFMTPETARAFEAMRATTFDPYDADPAAAWRMACTTTTVSAPVGCAMATDWQHVYDTFRTWAFVGVILQRVQGTTGQTWAHLIFSKE